MKKLLLILLCVPLIGVGQGWETTFGGPGVSAWGSDVEQTTDGGYIITGWKRDASWGVRKICLIKTDGNGVEQWSQTFEGRGGSDVEQTTDGGYIITGSHNSGNYNDVYLIKTDVNGDSLWTKSFGGTEIDNGTSVQQTTDGGYIITGVTESFGNGNEDVYLIKTDGNGDSLWTKTFGGTGEEYGFSVQQTTDGGYVICGQTLTTDFFGYGNQDVYLIKTDGNGDSLWTRNFGGTGEEYGGYSVQQTTDGGYIITGFFEADIISGNNFMERYVFLIKTDSQGDSLWSKTFGGTSLGYHVEQTTDGGYIITGETLSTGQGDVYLIKTDGNGDSLWSKTYGNPLGSDFGYSVQQTTDGGYIITGLYTDPSLYLLWDIYLIKTDDNGNVTSEFTIPMSSNRELNKVVDILGREVNEKRNTPLFYIYKDGTVEKRIIIE